MHRIARLVSLIASLCFAGMLLPMPAFGQASSATTTTPLVDSSDLTYEVQLLPEAESRISVLIVGIHLPLDTELPVRVRMPLPPEAEPFWAGEVFNEAAYEDIKRAHTIVEGVGGDSLEITLETTHTAQYDAYYRAMDVVNGTFNLQLDWIQTEPAKNVSFAVRIPTSTEDIAIEPDPPGSPQENLFGERLYTLAPLTLAPGDETQVSVSYVRPELAGGTDEFPLLPVIIGVLVVAIVVLVIAIVRQGRDQAAETEEQR